MDIFTSYSKIPLDSNNWDNSYKKIKKWAVTEKIHGSNFSFVFDVKQKNMKYAKRTGILNENEIFFGYKKILNDVEPKILLW